MSQADSSKPRPGWGKAVAMLACVFLLGIGVGFVLEHWRTDFTSELEQSGEIPLATDDPLDIRYPRPYASLPYLRVDQPILSYEIVGQTPQGFRIRITNFYANSTSAKYTAKGIPEHEQ